MIFASRVKVPALGKMEEKEGMESTPKANWRVKTRRDKKSQSYFMWEAVYNKQQTKPALSPRRQRKWMIKLAHKYCR